MKLLALTLMLSMMMFLQGCITTDCHGEYTYDDTGSNGRGTAAIGIAETNWRNWTGSSHTVNFSKSVGGRGMCHVQFVKEIPNNHSGAIGRTYTENGTIVVMYKEVYSTAKLGFIISHELGHSMGLGHVEGKGSIMSVDWSPNSQWSELDQVECRSAGVCTE